MVVQKKVILNPVSIAREKRRYCVKSRATSYTSAYSNWALWKDVKLGVERLWREAALGAKDLDGARSSDSGKTRMSGELR